MKKFRKLAFIAMIPVMALSVLSHGFILPSKNAYAAPLDYNASSYVTGGGLNIDNDGVKSGAWQAEYDLNDVVAPVPPAGTALLLKYPNGDEVPEMLDGSNNPTGKYLLNVAGYYSAVYTAGGKPVTKEYRFLVNAEDYQIELPFNGAEIPTLVVKGGEITLPKASIIYTDKKGEVVVDKTESDKIQVKVTDVNNTVGPFSQSSASMKFNAPQEGGKIFISYFYGTDAKAVIQKDYTVTVTDSTGINDRLTPSLNVSSVPTDVALMTKVTLPIASATDEQDKNVKIDISVKTPGDGTKVYTVKENMLDEYMLDNAASSVYIADEYKDKDGANSDKYYARDTEDNNDKDNGGNIVNFDNKRDMTFYPDKTGTYEITYTATNDVGKTQITNFKINVTDTEKPFIKIKASDIPTEWTSNRLIKLDGNTDTEKTYKVTDVAPESEQNLRLYFPKPAFADNASLESAMLGVNNNVRVELIKGSTTIETLKYASGYVSDKSGSDKVIVEDADRFYIPASKLETGADYEIAYYVSDTASPVRTAESRFSVKIKSELKDLSRPEISFDDIANTIKIGAKLTQPAKGVNIIISDEVNTLTAQDIRYALSSRTAAEIEQKVKVDFEDGIDASAGDYEFTDDLKDIFYKGVMEKFSLKAIDPAAVAGQYDKIIIYVFAKDAVGNERRRVKIINIIDTANAIAAPTFDFVKMYGSEIEDSVLKTSNGEDFVAGDDSKVVIDSIRVRQAGIKDTYLGYEFTVRKNGEVANVYTNATAWVDTIGICSGADLIGNAGTNTYLNIENFNFTPDGAGDYEIMLSVFNVSGAARTISFTLTVKTAREIGGGVIGQSDGIVEIPESLEFGRSVELPNLAAIYHDTGELVDITQPELLEPDGTSKLFYKTTINGPQYSTSGRELTALKTGDYKILISSEASNLQSVSYNTKISDSVGPAIKLTGQMPMVSFDREKDIFLPGMMSSDMSGVDTDNWTESVRVSNGGTNQFAKMVTESLYNEWNAEKPDYITQNNVKVGMYYFTPFADTSNKIDGKYTVTYYATDNNGQDASISFNIDVGDVFVPVITIKNNKDYAATMKKGDKFTFLDFEALDDTYEKNTAGVYEFKAGVDYKSSVVITLKAPDGSEVSKYENWSSTKKYETYSVYLDQVGDYTVTYTVTDKAGNEGTLVRKITVTEKTKTTLINEKVLAVILIVAGVLLIAGVAFYFVRFRKKAQ